MTGYKDNNNFADSIIDRDSVLDDAIDWISLNLDVDDVFADSKIKYYAKNNFEPEDVFENSTLEVWAESVGEYRKK